MATIRRLRNGEPYGEPYVLSAYCNVGRSSVCVLVLPGQHISKEHAAFCWSGTGWELRDLGTTNGTFVDGERLEPRRSYPIRACSRIAFGDPDDEYVLDEDSPPSAVLYADDGTWLGVDDEGVVAAPNAEHPELVISQRGTYWFVEVLETGERHRAQDNETLRAGDQSWRLLLPRAQESTLRRDPEQFDLARMSLEFRRSRDQERIKTTIIQGERTRSLKDLRHSYMLLRLAEIRLKDAEKPDCPEIEHGWVRTDALARQLRESKEQIAMLVFRARAQFRRAGVADADDIIERDGNAQELRLGIGRIRIL